jgi:hypothetical protein
VKHIALSRRGRCEGQMRDVPASIQEFVERYEVAAPLELTLRLIWAT